MLLFVPYKIVIEQKVTPWMNYVFIGVQILIFCLINIFPNINYRAYVLDGWSITGILGNIWIHKSFLHLLENLFFLWIFGNALCKNIGNFYYPVLYIMGGVIASLSHLLVDGRSAIGASGAINAVIIAFCLLFPYRKVRTIVLFFVIPVYTLSISGMWYLIIRLFYQFLFSLFGSGQVAYIAHFGGIIGGAVLTYLFIKIKLLKAETDNNILLKSIRSEIDGAHW